MLPIEDVWQHLHQGDVQQTSRTDGFSCALGHNLPICLFLRLREHADHHAQRSGADEDDEEQQHFARVKPNQPRLAATEVRRGYLRSQTEAFYCLYGLHKTIESSETTLEFKNTYLMEPQGDHQGHNAGDIVFP